jgi:hypothetical protein
MAYGFTVTSGDDNQPLSKDLLEAIAEVRVEQDLSKSAKFGIRFEDDLCKGNPKALSASALKPGTMIAVLVPDESDPTKKSKPLVCLVRGPITKLKSSAVLGGPGSWLEVHGEDRRILMDRESKTATWTGKASEIADGIFSTYKFDGKSKQSDAVEFTAKKSLNQSSADLKVIEDLARQLGYEFWLTYQVSGSGDSYSISETAKFEPSPDYPAGGGGGLLGAAASGLAAAASAMGIDQLTDKPAKTLKLSIADKDCSNLTAFDLDVDVERATAAMLDGIDDKSGKADDHEAKDDQPKVDPKASDDVKTFQSGAVRTIKASGAGSAADRASEAKATVTDDSWFITATASTSVFKLPGILQPHDIVAVEGTGFLHSGKYQVSKALHVINGWGHLMDLTLRRNALPERANA